ncbi:leader peptidase (prepilin peptidase)/N-methyltransferase [Erwinia toletana]|uniref:Prepilin leader peptidase/N-methyltransferase n=1 Tax=Winslowiella toletana TaxID=92490 RepID=A0ABS4PCT1_9GAMM|nr:A24 family peptidase [Winslowiella toletana]MBP2169738.1 leader peptidase (prepilin peptidase)/N-methyltransferase [Winslowiella toletana]
MEMVWAALAGAVIGSFLNVVIYRLPLMMAGETCRLSFPASHCPCCGSPVRWRHNLPLLGWLLLRGHCADCHQPISWRYPLVEGGTALLFMLVAFRYGLTWQSGFILSVICLLIALAVIDWRTMLLPDRLVLPLWVLGVAATLLEINAVSWRDALIASAIGFALPWLLDRLHYLLRGGAGMGMGDMKLFAALGACFGVETLCHIMLFAPLLALLSAVLLRVKKGEAFPFGPYPAVVAIFFLIFDPRYYHF